MVAALKEAINTNQQIREETIEFNMIACPGYPELHSDMIMLNNDRKNIAHVFGDAPLRLAATNTAVTNWATAGSSDGISAENRLTSADQYFSIYYPHALTTDLSGSPVVMPATYMALRTALRSDFNSYQWFSFAGVRRGLVDNATAIGYVDSVSGEFIASGISEPLRDTLYSYSINPITYLPNVGITLYGNKTKYGIQSALDRVNVSRLVAYVRKKLDVLSRPFIFEPNDQQTRNEIRRATEGLFNDLIAKRGISDYVVICDSSNNTPDRIARNELYLDVLIAPTKTVEFIYIPLRIRNPGDVGTNT